MMEFAVIGLAIADRFLLKRNAVKILHANQMDDPDVIRFVLGYQSQRAITSGTLTYSLRSKNDQKPSLLAHVSSTFHTPDITANT